MRDDPVRLIRKLLTLGENRNRFWILKFFLLFMFFLIELFITVPGIHLIISNTNFITFMEYFTPYSFLQPGCATLIIMGNFLTKVEKITSGINNISKVLETQNPTFEMEILKKARRFNNLSIVIPTLSVCTHLLCLPSLIDDGFETFLFRTIKKFYGDGPNGFYICLVIPSLFTTGLAIVFPMLFILYFTFHIQFQLTWLNEYVKQNLHKKFGMNFNNAREQELVHNHLLNVVKYRLCFKKAFDTIKIFQKLSILSLTLTGGLTAIMCIYNINNSTPQSKSLKLYLVMATLISITVVTCVCGQSISDESMKLRDILYESTWYYWNIKNRKILLLITTNIMQPWEISFYNLIPANLQFLTKESKFAYSTAAVLSELN